MKKGLYLCVQKASGQVLSALNFSPSKTYIMPIYEQLCRIGSQLLLRFKHFNKDITWTSVIADMPLSGAYNHKMAAIRLILTAEYERIGPN